MFIIHGPTYFLNMIVTRFMEQFRTDIPIRRAFILGIRNLDSTSLAIARRLLQRFTAYGSIVSE